MQFDGFKKEGTKFLKDLYVNNTKVWFENNRHIWEENILNPNKAFVDEMGETLQILVPTINAIPKASKSLFKIYRDTRFSKDKTPMKEKVGIIFWQGTTHRMDSSSFYFFYTRDTYYIGTGMRDFKTPMLKVYREYIKNETKAAELEKILNELKEKGYDLCAPRYKRIPKGIDKEYKYAHLALYGTLHAYKEYPIDEKFYKEEIIDYAFKHFDDMKDLQVWLYELSLVAKEENN